MTDDPAAAVPSGDVLPEADPLVQCTVRHPVFGLMCQKSPHPHARPHHAEGQVGEVAWVLSWWDTKAVLECPDAPADPARRARSGGPGEWGGHWAATAPPPRAHRYGSVPAGMPGTAQPWSR